MVLVLVFELFVITAIPGIKKVFAVTHGKRWGAYQSIGILSY